MDALPGFCGGGQERGEHLCGVNMHYSCRSNHTGPAASTGHKVGDFDIWPAVKMLPAEAVLFYRVLTERSVVRDLLLRGDKFAVLSSLVSRLLDARHKSHPGITRTKQRLREQYWWPALCKQVEQFIASCGVCQSVDKSAKPSPPPLQPVAFPSAP